MPITTRMRQRGMKFFGSSSLANAFGLG